MISNFDGYLGLRHFLYFMNERTLLHPERAHKFQTGHYFEMDF